MAKRQWMMDEEETRFRAKVSQERAEGAGGNTGDYQFEAGCHCEMPLMSVPEELSLRKMDIQVQLLGEQMVIEKNQCAVVICIVNLQGQVRAARAHCVNGEERAARMKPWVIRSQKEVGGSAEVQKMASAESVDESPSFIRQRQKSHCWVEEVTP